MDCGRKRTVPDSKDIDEETFNNVQRLRENKMQKQSPYRRNNDDGNYSFLFEQQ